VPLTVQILFPLPLPAFSYLVPFDMSLPALGCRVVVPWQNGLRLGIVIAHGEVKAAKALELKELVSCLDLAPFISASRIELLKHVAERTCSPEGQVLASLLPYGLHEELLHEIRAVEGVTVEGARLDLSADHWSLASQLKPSQLELYRQQGLLHERVSLTQPTKRVLKPLREVDDSLKGKSQAAQRRALEWLWEVVSIDSAAELARQADVSESAVRGLVKKGYVVYEEIIAPLPALPTFSYKALPEISQQLRLSLSSGISGGSRAQRLAMMLPHMQEQQRLGRSVLVLVPEHAYLVETANYLQTYLPVLTLSGELIGSQRQRLWQELQSPEPVVLVGTYLALLAPLEPLGLLIVLEAASSSYKLQSGPRLVIPEAARQLSEFLQIPLVLSESLASAEMLYQVKPEHHVVVPRLEQRVHIIDLESASAYPLSPELIRVVKQVEERSRQAIFLAPRRGFSSAFGCSTCQHILMCPNCDLSLRYHQQGATLRCHQCGFSSTPPNFCPQCEATTLGPNRGAGTQWIASELKKYSQLPIYRFDADRRDDLSPLFEGEPGFVVATTAILRQAPLPKLSLIALTLLDTLLTLSDFRAEEETLRLLVQLAELSPQRRPLVAIQTFQPQHPLLQAFVTQQLDSFAQRVLERRQHFSYPPFSDMAKIQVSAKSEAVAAQEAQLLGERLRRHQADVLGPSPAPIMRLKGLYTYQLFVRVLAKQRFQEVLSPVLNYQGRARVRVDVDPRDIGAFLE
jgi:primosomal protein N' (replication factor Y) (superfamily II helicase)